MLPDPRVTLLTFLLAFWLAFLLASSRTASFRSIGYLCQCKYLSFGKHLAKRSIFAANVPSEMPTRAPVRCPILADERIVMKTPTKRVDRIAAFLGVTDHIHRGIANVMPYVTRATRSRSAKTESFPIVEKTETKPRHA